jgi:hypothetical protein
MIALVEITDTKTGKVSIYREYWDEGSYFMWEEGNYACDCNRRLFFLRGQGIDADVDDAGECGDSQFKVCARDEDGEVLYTEYESL